QIGHGYFLELEEFHCGWLPLGELRGTWKGPRKFYESPALIGCALAVGRELYENLGGFDPNMRYWGVEDLDFGLKSWLMGCPILHDPDAVIGHRFRAAFDNFSVPMEHLLANQLRMARKNFTEATWSDWVDRCRARHVGRIADHPEGLWALAWELFQAGRASVEHERTMLLGHRRHDEFWYAERFGLEWPRLASTAAGSLPQALFVEPSPSPSPAPCNCKIQRLIDGTTIWKDLTNANRHCLPGEYIQLRVVCSGFSNDDITNPIWTVAGNIFKSWAADNQNGVLTLVSDADRRVRVFTFCFYAPSNVNAPLGCSFSLPNGKKCDINDFMIADDVTVTFKSTDPDGAPLFSGRTSLNSTKTKVGLYPPPGITFGAVVRVPPAYAVGEWNFVQVVIAHRTSKVGATCKSNYIGEEYTLDTTYPYSSTWPTGGTGHGITDVPDQALGSEVQMQGNDKFAMIIMFKPAGPHSQFVPIAETEWSWTYCCMNEGGWVLYNPAQSASAWVRSKAFPVWTQNVVALPYVAAPCPPACDGSGG
ncbi:MAG TPA: galactosyltransferase-related protein, partial [Pirellulales bacterium]|nr:galactosyltransferase-related protein [Pirellulales bacterium]